MKPDLVYDVCKMEILCKSVIGIRNLWDNLVLYTYCFYK